MEFTLGKALSNPPPPQRRFVGMNRDDLLCAVVRNLENPVDPITFTPDLEDYYRSSIAAQRRSPMLAAGGIGMAILWVFVILYIGYNARDGASTNFVVWLCLMGLINLQVAAYIWVQARMRCHRMRDRATMGILFVTAITVCGTLWFDEPGRLPISLSAYVMMPVACFALVMLHFRQAVAVSIVSMIAFAVLLIFLPGVDVGVKMQTWLISACAGSMAGWANWRTDRSDRQTFLLLTRERLVSEASRQQAAELREISTIDPLTQIPNRRAFEDHFRGLEARAAADSFPVALMMIDIDHFKLFNDHYGHLAGDACLQTVAATLVEQLRGPDDMVARLGGEEFVVVMPGLCSDDVAPVVERMRRAVEASAIAHEGVRGQSGDVVTISLGAAVASGGDMERRRSLLTLADRALYEAKRAGRNCWRMG